MKTLSFPLFLMVTALMFTGCATTRHGPLTFAAPSDPAAIPPKHGDYTGAYAYAKGRMAEGAYADAARYFVDAAQWVPSPGTEDRVWEFQNLVNAAWACLLAGDKSGARQWLDQAKALDVRAAPSDRANYLDSLLTGKVDPTLPPNLKSTLP